MAGSDRILLVAVELEKVRKEYTGMKAEDVQGRLERWLYVLTTGYSSQEEVERMAEMRYLPTIEEFAAQYGCAISDPAIRRAYDAKVDEYLDYGFRLQYEVKKARREGVELGREQGVELGREQERDQLASKLRELGVDESLLEAALSGRDA